MLALLVACLAAAGPHGPLARTDEATTVRRYWTVQGDGPVRPRWRNRRGRVLAWTWPDGVIEHYARREDDGGSTVHRFSAAGQPRTTTRLDGDDEPVEVVVHGPADVTLDVSGWGTRALDGATLRLPGAEGDESTDTDTEPDTDIDTGDDDAPVPPGDGAWRLGDGTLTAAWIAPIDVADPALVDGIAEHCACIVEDRVSTWMDGHWGVRFRLHHLHPTAPETSLVWLIPHGARVLRVGYTVPTPFLPATAPPEAHVAPLAPALAAVALLALPEVAE